MALIHGHRRHDNIQQALDLVGDGIDWASREQVLVKPNLVSRRRSLANTHVEAVRALLDWLRQRYDGPIIIAEGPADGQTWRAFADFGYLELASDYPGVELLDLNTDEPKPVRVFDHRLRPLTLRASRTALQTDCRISIGPPKTHESAMVTLALKNMIMGSLVREAPPDAPQPPEDIEQPARSAAKTLLQSLPRPSLRGHGLYTALPDWAKNLRIVDRAKNLHLRTSHGSDKRHMHQGLPHLHLNLFALTPLLFPHLSIIDGWEAMEGNGPTWGDPVDWRMAIASSDFLAADALAAELMGFPIAEVGYLHYCHRMGLGAGLLEEMEMVGNVTPQEVQRTFRPSPTQRVQRNWRLKNTGQRLSEALALNANTHSTQMSE